jgi:hypothetical protein
MIAGFAKKKIPNLQFYKIEGVYNFSYWFMKSFNIFQNKTYI